MTIYIIRRILMMILITMLVTILVFFSVRLLPGDPILLYLTQQNAESLTPERIEFIRHQFGLDRPIFVQYAIWLSNTVKGNLGESLTTRGKVIDDIKSRLPVTFYLGTLAFIISGVFGVPIGIISAVRRGTWLDNVLTSLGNLGVCIPIFWLGIILIYFFGLKIRLLPTFDFISPFKDFVGSIRYTVLPVFCLAVTPMASLVRLTRSSMLEVLKQDYIRTAWSKGLTEQTVIIKHTLKNSLIPVITFIGLLFGSIVGGSFLVEQVFSIPGMGRLAVTALFARDYLTIQGVMLIIGLFVLTINLIVDLSYAWLDPKVQYS